VSNLPKQEVLVGATLKVLENLGGQAHFRDIEKGVIAYLNIDANLTRVIRSGNRTELAYRLSWARTKCKALGKIENVGNGNWKLT
jgi:restriction endonuclease Mrr